MRVPSSYNGVVGFKTSTGRIDKTGIAPLSRTLDTIGPLTHSVEDCVLADMVLRGAVTTSVRRANLSSIKLFVPTNVVLDEADSAVVENFERSLRSLEANGIEVRRGDLAPLTAILE